LENNVPKGQEHPYLGISQRCDLERYSLDTVSECSACKIMRVAKRFRTFSEMALDFVKNQISCFQFTSVVVDIFDIPLDNLQKPVPDEKLAQNSYEQ
jgi:hypothetical protein